MKAAPYFRLSRMALAWQGSYPAKLVLRAIPTYPPHADILVSIIIPCTAGVKSSVSYRAHDLSCYANLSVRSDVYLDGSIDVSAVQVNGTSLYCLPSSAPLHFASVVLSRAEAACKPKPQTSATG